MASITIRHLDNELKQRLRIRSAEHGRSMEEEARDILRTTLYLENHRLNNLTNTIHNRFAGISNTELPISSREMIREPPDFST